MTMNRYMPRYLILSALAALMFSGCRHEQSAEFEPQPTPRLATDKDLATTRPSYWLDQPAVASVTSLQFQPLWNTCERVARSYLFELDRQDYRLGLLTTKPMISKQILEPWRKDAGTLRAVMDDSLSTIRRTLRLQIDRRDDGTFEMTPRVLIERETILERRLTSAAQYRTAFSGPAVGSRTNADIDANVPIIYWTPIGRDFEMERHVAAEVQDRLRTSR
jgi:hypothetical protein